LAVVATPAVVTGVAYSGPELIDTSRIYDGHNAIERAIVMCVSTRAEY
jgi:hypothetical protein